MKKYRDNGAVGAILDEYEKSISELIDVIKDIDDERLKKIADHETKNEDCISIQTVLSHVVRAGYIYVTEIRKSLQEDVDYRSRVLLENTAEYTEALKKMFQHNLQLFEDHPNLDIEEYDNDKKIKVRWGQFYDIEQLYEHAIVHILRHRRQIERFLQKN